MGRVILADRMHRLHRRRCRAEKSEELKLLASLGVAMTLLDAGWYHAVHAKVFDDLNVVVATVGDGVCVCGSYGSNVRAKKQVMGFLGALVQ